MTRRRSPRIAPLPRRRVLQGLGAGMLLAPLLPYVGARADDDSVRRPQNLVLVYHPNGLEDGWHPSGAAADFTFSDVLGELERHRERVLVVSGLEGGISNEIIAHGQGMVSMWTGKRISGTEGYSEYPSIDQLTADRLGSLAPFRSLEFGVQTVAGEPLSNTTAMSYRNGQPLQAEDDPATMFDRLFAAGSEDPAQLRAERKSIFDATRDSLADIRGAYGAEDRDRIDRHVQFLHETELRLQGLAELMCASQPARARNGADLAMNGFLFEQAADAQIDLLTAALSCGLTRVASLQYAHSSTNVFIGGYTMHGTMHAGTREQKVEINRWLVGQFARLLDRLAAVEFEDGTTLLDDTLVVWGTEMAVGNHLNFPLPYIIAGGGADGWFKLGHWIDLAEMRPQHTRLLISVLHAMGLDDVQSLGDFTDNGDRGPLDELRRPT